jgi:hypothetical protein
MNQPTKSPVLQHGAIQESNLSPETGNAYSSSTRSASEKSSLNRKNFILDAIPRIKEIITIPQVWIRLGYPQTRDWKLCPSPWREDRKPSFSVHDNGRKFKDFASDNSGSVIDFTEKSLDVSLRQAIEFLAEMAGISPYASIPLPPPRQHTASAKAASPPQPLNLSHLYEGTEDDWHTLAGLRGFSHDAIQAAVSFGSLRFGQSCGDPSWLIIDPEGHCAEARRMDGKKYRAIGKLAERKVHTLKGSIKGIPIGLPSLQGDGLPLHGFLLVEGSADYLAAWHFIIEQFRKGKPCHYLPLAILGGGQTIRPEYLPRFKDMHVRIFPHIEDKQDAGEAAAHKWARAIHQAGATTIDAFPFHGLIQANGQPVTDLNDAIHIEPHQAHKLQNIIP